MTDSPAPLHSPAVQPESRAPVEAPLSSMAILVVDDSSSSRNLIQSMLKSAGYENVLMADSAAQGFAMLAVDDGSASRSPVDLILMDLVMPDTDGFEACGRIKSAGHLRDVPIIMITADQDAQNIERAFQAGAIDFLVKPLQKLELRARVGSALSLKRERDIRRQREQELSQRNHELEHALQEVKMLRGIIPICSSCKKVRTDEGAWQQIESYIQRHSDARFSHGICSHCAQRLYPELYNPSETPSIF